MAARSKNGKAGDGARSEHGARGRGGKAGGEGRSGHGAQGRNARRGNGGSRSRGQGASRHGDRGEARDRRRREPVDPAIAAAELRDLVREQYGEELAGEIAQGFESQRPTTLRANTLKASGAEVRAALDEAGIGWRDVPWSAEALVIEGAHEQAVRELPLYERGEVYLQSLSSMVPPIVLNPHEGDAVLDMAAAPGGKTTQMAALSGNRVQITACERSTPRAERLRFNLERQGAGRVSVLVQDARRLDSFFRFDKILLDAPCSGSGTAMRDAAGLWHTGFSRDLLANCVRTQRGLLDKAVELLPSGGELVYSTCSILAQENEEQVRRLLASGTMKLLPIDPGRFEGAPLLPCGIEGALCICPSDLYEGFFVAHLQKR